MVIAVSASIIVVGTVGASAKDTSTKKTAASNEITDTGITVHYKSEGTTPYIYYWNSLPKNIETEYPGEQMTADKDNWYTTTFKDATTFGGAQTLMSLTLLHLLIFVKSQFTS